jgi:multidrug efflux pump subunit AcrA (membrane-fusion protein)
VSLLDGPSTEQAERIAETAEGGERAPVPSYTTAQVEEPTTLFSPGAEPEVIAYKQLPRAEPLAPGRVDRGSRAETVNYGGGLRPTSRRIAGASILAVVVVAILGTTVYLVNAETADRYSAAVVPANMVELNFQATAPLEALYAVPGERVYRGQLLAVEEDSTLKLEIQEQRVVVLADRLRLQDLEGPGTTGHERPTSSTVEQVALARATLSVAELQLAVDQSRLEESELRSPINGVVLHVAGTVGELVGPSGVRGGPMSNPDLPVSAVFRLFPQAGGASTDLAAMSEPVVSLVSGRRWQVVAAVPETSVESLHHGEQATFTFDAMGGLSVPASVLAVLDTPFELNGQVSYEVLLRLKARIPPGVLPGMTGTVSFS